MESRRWSLPHIVGSLVVCSLAALPLAATQKSPQKVFGEVKPDQALVYLIREGSMLGGGSTLFVYADQQFLGTLSSNSYTFTYVPPGAYLLWADPLNFTESNAHVELEAGKVYYFKVWNTFDPLDDLSAQAFLKGVKWYVTAEDDDRKDAKEQVEDAYAKATKKVATKPNEAPKVDYLSRREKHIVEWPQVDLKPYGILCVEDFVMADPKASSHDKDYLAASAPVRLAKLAISDLGPGVFDEVRQAPTCEAAPGVAVLRGRITEYEPGSETGRALLVGVGSAHLKVHFTLANGETGKALSELDAKGLWAWGGRLGASRGISDLEKNIAYEIAGYLKHAKGVTETPEATKE